MKKIIPLLISLCVASSLDAQNAYVGRNSIEFHGGCSVSSWKVQTENGSARTVMNGNSLNFRFNHFFNQRLGAWIQASDFNLGSSKELFFGAVNKADGGKYRYRFTYGYQLYETLSPVTAGAVYRLTAGGWSLCPRIGLGYGTCNIDSYTYERQSRDGKTGPEYFSFSMAGESPDYLLDNERNGNYVTAPVMLINASAQITCSLGPYIFLSAEAGMNATPFKIDVETTKTSSKHRFDPINFAEAVAYSGLSDYWVADPSSEVFRNTGKGIAPSFYFDLGIGIQIRNRRK